MSTNTIENEVVKVTLDPKGLNDGVKSSMRYLDELKKAFSFDKAVSALSNLQRSSDGVKFNTMSESIGTVTTKLSTMGIVAATVISNITTSVLNSVKSFGNTLVFEPIMTGLQEYETQMNAIQTILANTASAGKTLDDVVGALDELNLYADRTIYNFTEMTNNIGKFTAAGVGLETSVSAIKGIANLAAISGSNSQQASMAMYQLSQAISSGTVKLQDWNSVVNAGMGGKMFQDELVETAKSYGYVMDEITNGNKSFRASLEDGWLTSSVLLGTLQKFTGDITEEMMRENDYTEDEIRRLTDLATLANDAATKIKTFTQLKDTLSEALQSGWAESWRYIIGDFEGAKEFLGEIGDILGAVISKSAETRNTILRIWNQFGGRDTAIAAITISLKELIKNLGIVGAAFKVVFPASMASKAGTLNRISEGIHKLAMSMRLGIVEGNQLKRTFVGVASLFDIFRMVLVAVSKPIFALIKSLSPMAGGFLETTASVGDAIFAFRNLLKSTTILDDKVALIVEKLKIFGGKLSELKQKFLDLNVVKKISDRIKEITREDVINFFYRLKDTLVIFKNWLVKVGIAAVGLGRSFLSLNVIQRIGESLKQVNWKNFLALVEKVKVGIETVKEKFKEFRESLSWVSDGVKNLIDSFKNSDFVTGILAAIDRFKARRAMAELAKVSSGMADVSDKTEKIKSIFEKVKEAFTKVLPFFNKIGTAVKEGIVSIIDGLEGTGAEFNFDTLIGLITSGLGVSILLAIKKILDGSLISSILDKFFGEDSALIKSITGAFDSVRDTLVTFQNSLKADMLLKIAIAIGVVTASIIALSFIDTDKLVRSSAAIALTLTALFGATGVMGKLDLKGSLSSGAMIIAISAALLILSSAMSNLMDLKPEELTASLIAIGIALGEMIYSMKALDKSSGANILKKAVMLKVISMALVVLAEAVGKFGNLDLQVLIKGMAAVLVALIGLTGAVKFLSSENNKQLFEASIGILIISGALYVLTESVKEFGNLKPDILKQGLLVIGMLLLGFVAFSQAVDGRKMLEASAGIALVAVTLQFLVDSIAELGAMSWDEVVRGLVGIGGALAIIALAANLMGSSLTGAIAIVVISASLIVLAKALEILGNLSWDQLLVALAALAGVFVIFGLAGLVLGPLIPVFLALAGALALLGVGVLALGAGLMFAALGLTMLAASGTAVGGVITVLGNAIADTLPGLATAMGEGLVNFVNVIVEHAPELYAAGQTLFLGFIQSITDTIPQAVEMILGMVMAVLTAIAEAAPDFVQKGFDILLAFLQGIEDNIEEVVSTTLKIIAEFVNGVADGLPDVIDSGFNLILTFITSMTDAVEEYMPQIISAMTDLAVAMADGLITGISDQISRVKDAIRDMGLAAIRRLMELLGIHSPSRVLYDIAVYMGQGLINGLGSMNNKVADATAEMVRKVQNGISSLENDMTLRPRIIPVMELGEAQSGINTLNNYLDTTARKTAVLKGMRTSSGESTSVNLATEDNKFGGGEIKYVQNIYSPSPLTTTEIYRKTKSHIASIKRKNERGE